MNLPAFQLYIHTKNQRKIFYGKIFFPFFMETFMENYYMQKKFNFDGQNYDSNDLKFDIGLKIICKK